MNSETCKKCNGSGHYDALVSQHDNVTVRVVCDKCSGIGIVRVMTDEEEDDYWENYW